MAQKLPTRQLGKNGPQVTALGFGAMGLSAYYGTPKPDEERLALLDHVYASGELFWDSADIYKDNEDLLGIWFKKNPEKRKDIFLATKFSLWIDPATGIRHTRNEPEYIKEAIEKSLKRLGLPYVDLYYAHRIDQNQPIETTVTAMKELKSQGKVKYLGLSECSSETLRRACKIVHIDAVQIEYSPFTLDIEDPQVGLLKTCQELGTAVIAYSPLGRGFLTGAIKSPDDFEPGDFRINAPRFSKENFSKNLKLVEDLKAVAERKHCTPGQLVLAWLMAQGDQIIPIPGTTRIENFDENMGSLKVTLTEKENQQIRKMVEATQVHGHRYPEAAAKGLFADTVPLQT
ncbi:uncharacterized protein Z520_10061 [Fonsecaea multimorphosa CBS 102226]|uniref:NADP-dependent oxidoreductase domain-containing protein n=1 Tax=Fonsecaea multimorphosa CBS 102226 TaxID=1442371 RepID=A0A0D2IB23_9EURO|nr:uncharacterized protein Z520_10061 [Fonsecaea multimorphosa CBS 102226]KIX94351.1 hypothetical protein Z520_10061 [Fonsecaea multimorphosa CBS 102226]OAL19683.1 hypothetical protein AYO22_09555 [Fonsecaea multimorphosa]